MRGLNIQRIVIEKEENERLYKALDILKDFNVSFGITLDETGLGSVTELDELSCSISDIADSIDRFLDDLGYCEYIEIES